MGVVDLKHSHVVCQHAASTTRTRIRLPSTLWLAGCHLLLWSCDEFTHHALIATNAVRCLRLMVSKLRLLLLGSVTHEGATSQPGERKRLFASWKQNVAHTTITNRINHDTVGQNNCPMQRIATWDPIRMQCNCVTDVILLQRILGYL